LEDLCAPRGLSGRQGVDIVERDEMDVCAILKKKLNDLKVTLTTGDHERRPAVERAPLVHIHTVQEQSVDQLQVAEVDTHEKRGQSIRGRLWIVRLLSEKGESELSVAMENRESERRERRL
jgi:hypothetical protein